MSIAQKPTDRAINRHATPPLVAILLCTFNGAAFLREQLDSLARQTHENWRLWVSDDGSTDATLQILEAWQAEHPDRQVRILRGPQRGFAANFLSLTCNSAITADYFAFCDQDDIWQAEKLQRALDWIATVPAVLPALYCSRTRLISEQGQERGLSPRFSRQPGFANALVQNIGGGNTMLFNASACNLLRKAGPDVPVFTHDWWTYILITGCGGRVHYDPHPAIQYRQHSSNLIGRNTGWPARVWRLRLLLKGRFKSWNQSNLDALTSMHPDLTAQGVQVVSEFTKLRKRTGLDALKTLQRSGLYRQTRLGNFSLAVAAFIGRL